MLVSTLNSAVTQWQTQHHDKTLFHLVHICCIIKKPLTRPNVECIARFFFNVAVVVPIINQSCWLSALSNLKNTLELLGTWMFRFHTGINIYMNVHVHCDFVCCYCVNIWWFCPTFICVVTRLLCEQNFCWNNCWCSCVVWWCLLVLKHSINISITYEFDLC